MQTLKVKLDNGDIIDMAQDSLAVELAKHYPAWATKDIIEFLVVTSEGEPIILANEPHRYEVVGVAKARRIADMPAYDADDYEGMGDSEDKLNAWITDIESNLTGHISTVLSGEDSEFLILR